MDSIDRKEENIESSYLRKLNNIDEFIYLVIIYIGFNVLVYILKFLNEKLFQEKVKYFSENLGKFRTK